MNKKVIIGIIAICTTILALVVIAIITSFTFIKKNTDEIIKIQRDKLVTIIRVPNAVPPSNTSFNSLRYSWEMETPQKEVATVNVLQTTGFSKEENSIFVILENTVGGDVSIFDKILPSVVADEEVLKAAYSEEKITHLVNGKTGSKSAVIERNSANDKVTKITWEFEKDNFGENIKDYFDKVNSLPETITKTLYVVQSIIIMSLSGQ